jgi:hypothetical protein
MGICVEVWQTNPPKAGWGCLLETIILYTGLIPYTKVYIESSPNQKRESITQGSAAKHPYFLHQPPARFISIEEYPEIFPSISESAT